MGDLSVCELSARRVGNIGFFNIGGFRRKRETPIFLAHAYFLANVVYLLRILDACSHSFIIFPQDGYFLVKYGLFLKKTFGILGEHH
ncbi:hypothetical protein O91_00873 [Bartonella quintana JK 31]|uniref:Uncharacterized protein n=1 Tax=Bartonella quintana (strain Toulouse) TaxID=283165 RepID=A0A0H3M3S3_BARQU|nr:hypothetical protein O91_00873 [Bartonella quintana JK 31]CAF26562.1 hypothetical protein BQ11010 [Bartonella quintana str. Toulouse]